MDCLREETVSVSSRSGALSSIALIRRWSSSADGAGAGCVFS